VIKDEAGTDWLFHHAIDRRRPYVPEGDQAVGRPVLIERLAYRHGWPRVATNSPAVWARSAPVTR
jgi:arabinan endo-1,5-alpha-L-arabinosidase